jgi:hypothetical protein
VRPPGEVVQHADVAGVGDLLAGSGQRDPAHLVDLFVGGEPDRLAGPDRLGRGPELHPFGAPADPVADGLQAAAGQHPDRGLFQHLADGGLRQLLPRLALALGQ